PAVPDTTLFRSEDVIQETLMRAARYRRGLGVPARLEQWVVRIGRNVCQDRRRTEWRRRKKSVEETYFESLPGTEPAGGESEALECGVWVSGEELDLEHALRLLDRAIVGLPARDRALLKSFYFMGSGCRETAKRCGVPESLVKVRLFRMRRRLGRELERLVVRLRVERLGTLEGVA